MVLHEDGVVVEAPEAGRAHDMREPVAARLELAIADRFTRPGHHDGGLVGARLSVLAGIHGAPYAARMGVQGCGSRAPSSPVRATGRYRACRSAGAAAQPRN